MVSSGSSGLPLQLNTWEDHALDVSSPRLFDGGQCGQSLILILYATSTSFQPRLLLREEAAAVPPLPGYNFRIP
jgi:hypothetical protein